MPDEHKPAAQAEPAATEHGSDEADFDKAFDDAGAAEAAAGEGGGEPTPGADGKPGADGADGKPDGAADAGADGVKKPDEKPDAKPAGESKPTDTPEDEAKARVAEKDRAVRQERAAQAWWGDVQKLHPDVGEILPGLREWLKGKPKDVQDRANGTPADAATVIAEYKAETAKQAGGDKAEGGADVLGALRRYGIDGMKVQVTDADGNAKDGTLSELATTYPDIMQGAIAVAEAVFQHRMADFERRLQSAGFATRADLDQFGRGIGDLRLANKHPDHATVAASQAFKDYLAAQEAPIRKLWDSDDPEDKIAILSSFKRSQQAEANGARRKDRAKDFQNRQALHSGTVRGDGAARQPGAAAGSEDEEFDEGWDEAAGKGQ